MFLSLHLPSSLKSIIIKKSLKIHFGQEVRMSGTRADTISFVNWLIFGIIFNLKTYKMNELFLKDECSLALPNINSLHKNCST